MMCIHRPDPSLSAIIMGTTRLSLVAARVSLVSHDVMGSLSGRRLDRLDAAAGRGCAVGLRGAAWWVGRSAGARVRSPALPTLLSYALGCSTAGFDWLGAGLLLRWHAAINYLGGRDGERMLW